MTPHAYGTHTPCFWLIASLRPAPQLPQASALPVACEVLAGQLPASGVTQEGCCLLVSWPVTHYDRPHWPLTQVWLRLWGISTMQARALSCKHARTISCKHAAQAPTCPPGHMPHRTTHTQSTSTHKHLIKRKPTPLLRPACAAQHKPLPFRSPDAPATALVPAGLVPVFGVDALDLIPGVRAAYTEPGFGLGGLGGPCDRCAVCPVETCVRGGDGS